MTPHRRRLIAGFIALGLALVVGLGIVLATSLIVSPPNGPRDDGGNNQTPIHLSGDLLDGPDVDAFTDATPYWDLDPSADSWSGYQMTIIGSPAVGRDGTFDFDTEVPLYDNLGEPVRPGNHVITVCASHGDATSILVCVSDNFKVKKGTASFTTDNGRPGDTVTVTGARWVPGNADEAIQLIWAPNGSAIDLDGTDTFYPDSSAWTFSFQVPYVDPGTYKIKICNVAYTGPDAGGCATADTVFKSFTVDAPTVELSKNSGHSGDLLDVSGTRFFGSEPIYLFIGPKGSKPNSPNWVEILPGTTKMTDEGGNFGPYTFAASGSPGDYTVLACTPTPSLRPSDIPCETRDTGKAPYTIIAAATPTPSPTPTRTASPTPTRTPSPTPTRTPSPTPTKTPSPKPTPSPTLAPTATPTASPTSSPTPSPTPTPTLAPTATPTAATTATPSPAPTEAPTAAPTDAPTATPAPPSPTPSPTQAAVVTWPEHLHTPGQTSGSLDVGALTGISLLALLIAFLVPFPGTLFNKTVEENYEEIQGWISGARRRWTSVLDMLAIGPLGGVRRGLSRLLTGGFGVWIFLGMSALVYGFLSPTFGFDSMSLALFLGLLVGLAFITAAFDLPLRIYHGRTSRAHDRGVLRALWWTLFVAVICVIVSRLADFQPGYLYGLIISIVFVTEISKRDQGVGTWLAAVWLLILSFGAWILLAVVRQGTFDPWLALFLQTVLVTFVVAGIETLAVGLLPMRFLPGHPLYQWRRGMWFAIFALSIMGYLLILVDPANGYLSDDSRTPVLIGIIFLVVFGIVSFGTWAYFRFRPAHIGGDRPGEAPAG